MTALLLHYLSNYFPILGFPVFSWHSGHSKWMSHNVINITGLESRKLSIISWGRAVSS